MLSSYEMVSFENFEWGKNRVEDIFTQRFFSEQLVISTSQTVAKTDHLLKKNIFVHRYAHYMYYTSMPPIYNILRHFSHFPINIFMK